MGIKQRRERERQEIRNSILSAARQIAIEEGWQAVTTRKVAERIEYSQPTIYEYFDNKEAILLALVHYGFERLLVTMQAAGTSNDKPEEHLLAQMSAYWDFAFDFPELFQVMYGLGGVSFTQPETPDAGRQAFALLRETLQAWAAEMYITLNHPDDAVNALWGTLHGLVVLAMADRIAQGRGRAKGIMQKTVRDLLLAWSQRAQE